MAKGATTDAAVVSDANGTISGKLRGLVKWAFERMPATLAAGGGLKVEGVAGGVAQPVSALALPLPAGAATEATLATRAADATITARLNILGQKAMAASAPVVLASDQSALGVTGPLTDAQLRASAVPVSGTFFQTTQPISAVALPLPGGASTEATLATRATAAQFPAALIGGRLDINAGAWLGSTTPTVGQKAMAACLPVALASDQSNIPTAPQPATLTQVVTGGANAIATATLPAVAGQFHYITHISIRRVTTAALAGGLLLTVTTTNLGGRAWRTGNQASILISTFEGGLLLDQEFVHPLKSAVVNTASTIVCPTAGVAVSWQIIVDYYTAP